MPPVLVELKVDPQTLAVVPLLGHGHQLVADGDLDPHTAAGELVTMTGLPNGG